jgi:hypothetical protein
VFISRARRPNTFDTYTLYVNISQCKPEVLDMLHEKWGGCLNFKAHAKYGANRIWYWKISNNTAVEFLRWIRPYLVHKVDEVDFAFRFMDHKFAYDIRKLQRIGHQGTIDRVDRERERFWQEMKDMKHRWKQDAVLDEE